MYARAHIQLGQSKVSASAQTRRRNAYLKRLDDVQDMIHVASLRPFSLATYNDLVLEKTGLEQLYSIMVGVSYCTLYPVEVEALSKSIREYAIKGQNNAS